ncbi:MAG TPA: hypothetical protein VJ201_03205, partial [Candidatus Babeliales bacterium]|nr:hypothetical protein [Candidatus Babeliales bacterium]
MIILANTTKKLLSDFCLDISKAYFIVTFVNPVLSLQDITMLLVLLTKGIISSTIFLTLSWLLIPHRYNG